MAPLLACAKGFSKPWGSVLAYRNRLLVELHICSSIRVRICRVKQSCCRWLYEFVTHLLSCFQNSMQLLALPLVHSQKRGD